MVFQLDWFSGMADKHSAGVLEVELPLADVVGLL
jgi:hypothetical protein